MSSAEHNGVPESCQSYVFARYCCGLDAALRGSVRACMEQDEHKMSRGAVGIWTSLVVGGVDHC